MTIGDGEHPGRRWTREHFEAKGVLVAYHRGLLRHIVSSANLSPMLGEGGGPSLTRLNP